MKKLDYIDALRGFAILGVLLIHCSFSGKNDYPTLVNNIIWNGARGVQLFYVLSAFTLFLSLSNQNNEFRSNNLNFFIRRFFRIAPMYYISIFYYSLQSIIYQPFLKDGTVTIINWGIISNIFFFHGISPYWINNPIPGGWSVAVEMPFYCLMPFLFKRIKNLNQAFMFLLFSVGVSFVWTFVLKRVHFVSDEVLWNAYIVFSLPSQLPSFACGVIMFFLITTPREKWLISNHTILILIALLFLDLMVEKKYFYSSITLFAMVFTLFGYVLSRSETSIFVNPISKFIGKISYSMYLTHFAILFWMEKLKFINFVPIHNVYFGILNLVIRFSILLILTGLLSTLFFKFIEIPFQKLGKQLSKRYEKRAHGESMLPTIQY